MPAKVIREADVADPVRYDVPMRSWTVLAQDPSILGPKGRALTTRVSVARERLEPGPKGHRIHVIDFDAATQTYYKPRRERFERDPYEKVTDVAALLRDPYFHQQNVYAIAMATLSEFETALGRTVSWGFGQTSHHLKIAPHAFADANAYYSRESESLSFGYFAGANRRTVFTCLSHDVVAHETAHALLDGLRTSFLRPSHPDQWAFHEGFADIVALLSVFKSPELLEQSLAGVADRRNLIPASKLSGEALASNVLMKLAEQFGSEVSQIRGEALRHSVAIAPSPAWLQEEAFQEPHRRGEILVAAVMHAFLEVWSRRLDPLGRDRKIALNRTVVAEEGATAAGQLLRVAIRALDYLPPVDMTFGDYLSALLTADLQLYPDDTRYEYRRVLIAWFGKYGIRPANRTRKDGAWDPPPGLDTLSYHGLHFESMQRDPDAVFRFIWQNRDRLGISPDAFTRVISVRPCTRVSNDGLILRETVVEYLQILRIYSSELKSLKIRKPKGLSSQRSITLLGGGTLVFDQFGRLKFHIGTGVTSPSQSARLQSLYDSGHFDRGEGEQTHFAQLHRRRALHRIVTSGEQW